MSSKAKQLVLSLNREVWDSNEYYILLDESFIEKIPVHIKNKIKFEVAPNLFSNKTQKDLALVELKKIEADMLKYIVTILNEYHEVRYSEKFWKILLGHWLRAYIQQIYYKAKIIENVCNQNYFLDAKTIESLDTLVTSSNLNDFYALCKDSNWNFRINSKIFFKIKPKKSYIEISANKQNVPLKVAKKENNVPAKLKFKKTLASMINKINGNNSAFIVSTFLPRFQEIKLNLLLKQLPNFYARENLNIDLVPNHAIRAKIIANFNIVGKNQIERIIYELLFEELPVIYLEGFKELNKFMESMKFPTKPKFIFTASNFVQDDAFMLWSALQVEKGTKYFVGQHGNNYGTNRYMYKTIEQEISDKFLTWGWSYGSSEELATFNFKVAGKQEGVYNLRGGLLLVEAPLNDNLTSFFNNRIDLDDYFILQNYFISKLHFQIQNSIIIRTYLHNMNMHRHWHSINTNLEINSISNFRELVSRSRLTVFTYDSTGILENLTLNTPTMAYIPDDLNNILDQALPYYNLLVKAGVLHISPKSLAEKVNQVWPGIEEWWLSPEVQDARNEFCLRYSRVSKKPALELKKILLQNI
jgi:putative transferase (TIGR04331 family)